jgi:hypothetical protein
MTTYFPQIPSTIAAVCDNRFRYFSLTEVTPASKEIQEVLASKRVFLSTKQVPTCLAVRAPGSHSLTRKAGLLNREGFPIEELSSKGNFIPMKDAGNWDTMVSASQISYISTVLSSVVAANNRSHDDGEGAFELSMEDINKASTPLDFSSGDSEDTDSEESGSETGAGKKFRLRYQDAFAINAALVYAGHLKIKKPDVLVWEGDSLRLFDKIPSTFFGKHWKGRRPVKIPFFSIADPDIKIYLIKHRTYWGKELHRYIMDKECVEHTWAKTLWKRVKCFLRGQPDPKWNRARAVECYGEDYKASPRDTKKRAARFLQLLLTIDGIFQQRYLSDMGEMWNWKKFDNFVLMNLSLLIGDEFIDGEIPKSLMSYRTAYTSLKGVRQLIKEFTHSRRTSDLAADDIQRNPFARILTGCLLKEVPRDRFLEMRIRGMLSQTRGAGTPPPLVALQAKIKLLETLMQLPEKLTRTERILISGTMKQIVSSLPDEAFTGLRTKAGIRASTSSCFEKTRAEGGTAQAISDIVCQGKLGRRCRIYNLETGREESMKYLHECTPGEYIFWRCLEEVLTTDPEQLGKVYALVVSEPGKARSVTKGSVALKVVLDVVNGICSWPVHKAFPSSTSGMSKEAHGWNLFRAFENEDFDRLLFTEKEVRTEYVDPTSKKSEVVYNKCFSMSTDFETATDFMHHEVAGIIGSIWMRKVGIPPILMGIVNGTCFQPRLVYFTARGCFAEIGEPVSEDIRSIKMLRGVLMGDPLTKVILHLVNICARSMASMINNDDWMSRFVTNAMSVKKILRPPEGFSPTRRFSS